MTLAGTNETSTKPRPADPAAAAQHARFVREHLPAAGLFAGQHWRICPAPFPLGPDVAGQLESLGRVMLQFYRAVNLLYRRSVEGKQPEWIARWLDLGKPTELIALQRAPVFRSEVPRVIRPDILLTDHGVRLTELDSVPGGIGLTAWLNHTYAQLQTGDSEPEIIGGAEGMVRGFESIFDGARTTHIVVSEEAATYRPEMEWLVSQLNRSERSTFNVQRSTFNEFRDGDAVYRFFELFDLANVPNAKTLLNLAAAGSIRLTPPPKPLFEEKMLFALLWNRNLHDFWRQELGASFFQRLKQLVPYTWIMDPSPLPPHAAIPGLELTDWRQLKTLSKKERELIVKVSGFSEHAWGARGVFLGSDLPHDEWARAVDEALEHFDRSPRVLQRYHKPALVDAEWFDFENNQVTPMKGRARLCPYYFVTGEGDAARAQLGGVLATVCPADKKIIHGMPEAIFAPGAA